jgi:hypothetical protein
MPTTEGEIARSGNGVVTPLYFDRQVVRAEDLTLDRASHDAESARMRRYLHGWGVVAGLAPTLTEGTTGPRLTVPTGYGVTPSGEEVLLTEPIVVDGDLGALVRTRCGPGSPGCELPAPGAAGDADAEVVAWLVARPVHSEADLRAGVPAGCEHPASVLMPSRACHGVSLELRCAIPPLHEPPTKDCPAVTGILWGDDPFSLPASPNPGDDCLVLARLVAGPESVVVDLAARRRLLPLWVLQEWILACAPRPSPFPSPAWTGWFADGPRLQLLTWDHTRRDYLLGGFTGDRFGYTPAGTSDLGEGGSPTWTGNFTGTAKTEILLWHPGTKKYWLGRLTGNRFGYTPAGTADAGGALTWTGDFTGAGKTEILLWHPSDKTCRLGTFTGNQLSFTPAGTADLGGALTWTGNFTGTGKTEILVWNSSDKNYRLGTFDGNQLGFALAGNSSGFGGAEAVSPTWTGNFTGTGKTEILFWYPGDRNYWLGMFTGNLLGYKLVGNSSIFGGAEATGLFWIGDFTGAGNDELLFYQSGDGSYFLGRFVNGQLHYTFAGR